MASLVPKLVYPGMRLLATDSRLGKSSYTPYTALGYDSAFSISPTSLRGYKKRFGAELWLRGKESQLKANRCSQHRGDVIAYPGVPKRPKCLGLLYVL